MQHEPICLLGSMLQETYGKIRSTSKHRHDAVLEACHECEWAELLAGQQATQEAESAADSLYAGVRERANLTAQRLSELSEDTKVTSLCLCSPPRLLATFWKEFPTRLGLGTLSQDFFVHTAPAN